VNDDAGWFDEVDSGFWLSPVTQVDWLHEQPPLSGPAAPQPASETAPGNSALAASAAALLGIYWQANRFSEQSAERQRKAVFPRPH
jgi:hypothetical protein